MRKRERGGEGRTTGKGKMEEEREKSEKKKG